MLDPRLLRAFVAIADAGSFTAAADRLHMTQSTMSQQIARLEDAIGRALVDRAARPVRLTVTGERLLGHARRILALQDEALTLVAKAGTPLAEVEAALAAGGQRLAFEPADWRGLLRGRPGCRRSRAS